MYKIYLGNNLIHDDGLEMLKVFNPKLEQEINKTGSFTFTIYSNNMYYGQIQRLRSIITVYQNNNVIFKGRVLNEELGFNNEKYVTCEGELAFLLDTISRPHNFTGTIKNYLSKLITEHNSQVGITNRFTVGNVTVSGNITVQETEYKNTLAAITERLINSFGGYILTRESSGVNYIDYLQEITTISNQEITFAKNLLDLKVIKKGEDIATAIIPLGAKLKDASGQETDERLTIKSVNNNIDYISEQNAVNQYGFILRTEIFEDITVASELLTKGRARLSELVNMETSIELSAADLASVGENVNSFKLGTKIRVLSEPHGLNQIFTVSKISIDLLNPAANKLTLGKTIVSFTESAIGIKAQKGEQGAQGVQGEQGEQGERGIQGERGVQGQRGEQGIQGVAGRDGINGQDGQDGKDAAIQSATEPADKSFMWLDISHEPPILKRYNPALSQWEIISDTEAIFENIIILEENLNSQISQTVNEIRSQVSEEYYLKSDANELVNKIDTEFIQTNEEFEFKFNEFSRDLNDVATGTEAQFQNISKYIRFVDGNILLGEEDNPLTLTIENDRISFLQENVEVAYFSNNKLFVTDGHFINSLQLGDFTFIPRSNGNLSFKKVSASGTNSIAGLALVGTAIVE